MNSFVLILVLFTLCGLCNACGDYNRQYPWTEEQLIQEVKKDLNLLERNPKADDDFPAVQELWDLINSSNYIGTPAFTNLLLELAKSSERVLYLLVEHNPKPKGRLDENLISAMKDLMQTFAEQAALRPNKPKTRGFLNFRM